MYKRQGLQQYTTITTCLPQYSTSKVAMVTEHIMFVYLVVFISHDVLYIDQMLE